MARRRPIETLLRRYTPAHLREPIEALLSPGSPEQALKRLAGYGAESILPTVAALVLAPTDRRRVAVELAFLVGAESIDPLLRILETPGRMHVPVLRRVFEEAGVRDYHADDEVYLAHKRACEIALHALTAVAATHEVDYHTQWELSVAAAHRQDATWGIALDTDVNDARIVDAARQLTMAILGPKRSEYRQAFDPWPLLPYEPGVGLTRRARNEARRQAAEVSRRDLLPPPLDFNKNGGCLVAGCLSLVLLCAVLY